MTRTRLAPSPTGAQHLGNARTHLIAFWAARKWGDELVLRIDDLDSPRVKAWAIEQAVEDIRWLGIDFEGEPVRQSEHIAEYRRALAELTDPNRNWAYPCTCTRKDIAEALSAPHEGRFREEGPVYPGTCSGYRPGDPLDSAKFCWRLRTSDRVIEFDDECLGLQRCNPAKELGDFPITTKTGQASYQLAVVVDDLLQGVDRVVRGNDLVASTFRQLELYARLGQAPPRYAHVPLVRGPDGRRLAKRHGDTRLSHYRELGIAPQRIVGWAAHSLGMIDRPEDCDARDLVDRFNWSTIPLADTTLASDPILDPK